VRQRLHRHCQSFHRRCFRRRRHAPPWRRRTRRRVRTTKPRWASYRNGYPSRSSLASSMRVGERGSQHCGPRGRSDRPGSPDDAPSMRAPHLPDSLRRSKYCRGSRTHRSRRRTRSPRSEPAPKYRHRPRAHPTAALMKVAPPRRRRAPSPGQRPRATRRLRAANPGPSSISPPIDRLRDTVSRRHFSADHSMQRYLRFLEVVKNHLRVHDRQRLSPRRGCQDPPLSDGGGS